MRKSDWITAKMVAVAAERLVLQYRGNSAAVNANMVAVALGKPKANKTVYHHFRRWQEERTLTAEHAGADTSDTRGVEQVRSGKDDVDRDLRADIDILLEAIDALEGELAALRVVVWHYEALARSPPE